MRKAGGRSGRQRRQRGQSSVVGVALVFGMVIAGSVATVTFGVAAVQDTQDRVGLDRAENAMAQFDSQAAMVAIGDSHVQQVVLESHSPQGYTVENGSGWMNVSYTNTTNGDVTTVFNQSMGAIVYSDGDQNVTYQGGGVWKGKHDDSVMVSPPEFHYRDATLTLPMVQVRGDSYLSGKTAITKNSSTTYFPNESINDGFRNPLAHGKMNVTVQSRYYKAWGKYFEERTDGNVRYDPDRQRVTLTLVVPAGPRSVQNAVTATSESGQIKLTGTDARTDSYNSSNGDGYDGEGHTNGWNNGTIATAGDIQVTSNSVRIYGNISAGGIVDLKQADTFQGERVEYGDGYEPDDLSSACSCPVEQISAFEGDPAIDSHINETVDEIEAASDNDGTIAHDDVIDGGDATETGPLPAGRYHVDHIDLTDDVEFDTSGGNITIAVENYVSLNDKDIAVTGNNRLKIYVKGMATGPSGYHFFTDGGDLTTPTTTGAGVEENATQVWIYGRNNFQGRIEKGSDSSKIVGSIYAPGGRLGNSRFEIRQSDLYGGAVASFVVFENKGGVHYDLALRNTRTLPKDTTIVKVTYIHASVNRVYVTSA